MRLAQITDLHLRWHQPGTARIARRRSRDMPRLFEQALQRIVSQSVDMIAVTGDLLDVPSWLLEPPRGFQMDEPQPWLDAAREDYRLIRRRLDDTGVPYVVLPGNHDYEELMWEVFDPEPNVMDVADCRVAWFCDREHEGHQPRRFNPERARWKALLADADSPVQVHLQHYVITPTLDTRYPHTYAEGESLTRDIVQSGRVRLCLSGHYHRGTPLLDVGPTTFATTPAFCEHPFSWRIYDVGPKGHVQMVEQALERDASPQPVVFLDRDGVINDRDSYQQGPEAMHLLPNAAQAIRRLRKAGKAVVVVTNQSAVGMGYVPEDVVIAVNDKMFRLLHEEGADLTGIYFSCGAGARAVLPRYFSQSEAKPEATMFLQAARELDLDLAGAYMVGDSVPDIEAAHRVGIEPILVETGRGMRSRPKVHQRWPETLVVDDLAAAVDHILSGEAQQAGPLTACSKDKSDKVS